MSTLSGKVIAITGAASGIGHTLSQHCAQLGASLSLADIQAGPLSELSTILKTQHPDINILSTVVDVSSSSSVDAWISSTVAHFSRLDGAVNLAGVEAPPGRAPGQVLTQLTETDDDTWNFIIGINLTGLFYCLRAELRVMGAGGSVVNASSIAGLMGRAGLAAYASSKHGVVGLTKTAAKEVGKRGIRVNAIAPGPVETPMLKRLMARPEVEAVDGEEAGASTLNTYKNLPMQRLGRTDEIAKTICFLLSDDSSWTTGVALPVDGGVMC